MFWIITIPIFYLAFSEQFQNIYWIMTVRYLNLYVAYVIKMSFKQQQKILSQPIWTKWMQLQEWGHVANSKRGIGVWISIRISIRHQHQPPIHAWGAVRNTRTPVGVSYKIRHRTNSTIFDYVIFLNSNLCWPHPNAWHYLQWRGILALFAPPGTSIYSSASQRFSNKWSPRVLLEDHAWDEFA